jgi:heme transport system permease protein
VSEATLSARDAAAQRMTGPNRRIAPSLLGAGLCLALAVLAFLSVRVGSTGFLSVRETLEGLGSALGLAAPRATPEQAILELHLWRTLVAIGVGAGLALSGALLQGVFRNGLASPAIIGVTSGAGLGASVAILIVGGYGSSVLLESLGGDAAALVTLLAFGGALAVCAIVTALSTTGGRISVPTLLLTGVAMNLLAGGILAAIQSFALQDLYVAQAILTWTFGTLDDRTGYQAAIVWGGVALAAAAIPFVALELDLFAGGEEDAQTLGVNPTRVKLVALAASALAAAVAVAAAGQIAFVGLVVPHLVRLLTGASHRSLLLLCLVGGPVFLLGCDVLQRWLLGSAALQPGVLMSLIGGPFFIYLLYRNRSTLRGW